MELGAHVGITPDEVVGSLIELMYRVERQMTPEMFALVEGRSAAECEALAKRSFQDEARDAHVALGGLRDPHHSTCYRAFNLQRERMAHRYGHAVVARGRRARGEREGERLRDGVVDERLAAMARDRHRSRGLRCRRAASPSRGSVTNAARLFAPAFYSRAR
jgi:hypothetical protein